MAIDQQTRSEILRLSRAEGWPVGTIARHLGIHHGTVTRALEGAGAPRRPQAKMIDPYVPFIREQLEKEPGLSATLLREQVRKRGCGGGPDHFRHLLRDLGLRPEKKPDAAMRLRFLPAELAQVGRVELGRVTVGPGRAQAGGLRHDAQPLEVQLPAPVLQRGHGRLVCSENRKRTKGWLWKILARVPVENPPLASRRLHGSFLCRDRRRQAWRRRSGAWPRRTGRTGSTMDRASGSVRKRGRPALPSASRVLDGCLGSRTGSSRG